ncbi:MAG TPA: nitronate monooxygenase [Ktedonobacterales bacterium]|nr:nitronate monooxygenase [Ktedonobacterales bacterium]
MLRTPACETLGIAHPIVQAGMAREYTNAELVAAVSAAGGLGILGCLGRPADETVAAIRRIRSLTDRPFGVNFVLLRRNRETFAACLAERVPVFSFFRGDPEEAVTRAHAAGAVTIHQVTTVAEAERAVAVGVDVLVAQGCEAGGHMGPLPLLSFLPAVVGVAGGRPVLAAGGISDGRGLAAALCLGAAGVLMGTRFLATPESPISPAYKRAILAAGPGATVASGLFDLLWGFEWPGVRVRAIRNALTDRWAGREDELADHLEEVRAECERADRKDDPEGMALLAGESVGRIDAIQPAGAIVRSVAAEAERVLREWGARVSA